MIDTNKMSTWEYALYVGIVQYPNECLRTKSIPVEKFDKGLREIVNKLKDAVGPYIGLGAPQIGINKQVVVMRFNKYYVLINPTIINKSEETINYMEKCLSIPEEKKGVSIDRAAKITVKYYDISGEEQEETFVGLGAIAVAHELDHLEGKLIIDYKIKGEER